MDIVNIVTTLDRMNTRDGFFRQNDVARVELWGTGNTGVKLLDGDIVLTLPTLVMVPRLNKELLQAGYVTTLNSVNYRGGSVQLTAKHMSVVTDNLLLDVLAACNGFFLVSRLVVENGGQAVSVDLGNDYDLTVKVLGDELFIKQEFLDDDALCKARELASVLGITIDVKKEESTRNTVYLCKFGSGG